MKKTITSILMLLSFGLNAQDLTTTFEDLTLAPESYWTSTASSDNYFISNYDYFPSKWDTSFGGYWIGGFGYSNMTDSVTSGYTNAFSAKAGSGYNGSANYAVAYDDGYFLTGEQHGNTVTELWITNSTYAYNSMRDGDGVGKKFGGITGNDPDIFSVTFRGFWGGQQIGQPVTFYLADFRNPDNSQDYIIHDWTSVLGIANIIDSVAFSFASSDTGAFGINTPKYICMDNISMETRVIGLKDIDAVAKLHPNPSHGPLNIKSESQINSIRILDLSGRTVYYQKLNSTSANLDLSFLNKGIYTAEIISGNKRQTAKFVIAD